MIEYSIHPDLKHILIAALRKQGMFELSECPPSINKLSAFVVFDKDWPGQREFIEKLHIAHPNVSLTGLFAYRKDGVDFYIHYPRIESMIAFLCEWSGLSVHKTWARMFPTYEESSLSKYVQIFWKAQYLPSEIRSSFVTKELKTLSESTFSLYLSLSTWKEFIQKVIDLRPQFHGNVLQMLILGIFQKVIEFKQTKRLPINAQLAEAIQNFALIVSKKDLFLALDSLYNTETDLLLRLAPLRDILWSNQE